MLIQLDNSLVELIKYKLFISGSGNYSLQTVLFAFTPSSILGTEMFDNSFIYSSDKTLNVGLVSFILNLFFLVIFIFKIVKLILHSNSNVKMLGFCVLYFFLHSSKYCMRSYSFTLLLFMVFILNVTYRNLNRDECFR